MVKLLIKAGDYKLKWDGSGSNVELSIMRGKNVIAKAPARLVDLEVPADEDAALVWKNDSGTEYAHRDSIQGQEDQLGDNSNQWRGKRSK